MPTEVAVFLLVYLGMAAGRIPGLAIDRTGVAVLGATVLVALGAVSATEAWDSMDVSTMTLLLGLMVVSAQLRLGGFYGEVTRRLARSPLGPRLLLLVIMTAAGALSAVLTNDVICLAMCPLIAAGCVQRGLNPVPYLLGLACASNIGSATTLVGNPQNILIGQSLDASFGGYLVFAALPVSLSLLAAWAILVWQYRGNLHCETQRISVTGVPFNQWQSLKGCCIVVAVIIAFLIPGIPREITASAAAGAVLISRRMHTRETLGLVDWQVLVLFAGLFVVNHAFEAAGALASTFTSIRGVGIHLEHPGWLFAAAALLSNLVSNVPAVMLLLPAATHPDAAAVLALSSTLAGNLIVVSSIANIIVVEQAREAGVSISWFAHARTGVPVTLLTLAIAALWIWLVQAV